MTELAVVFTLFAWSMFAAAVFVGYGYTSFLMAFSQVRLRRKLLIVMLMGPTGLVLAIYTVYLDIIEAALSERQR